MSTAWAQTAAEGPPPEVHIGFLLLVVAVFYFLLIRPEQKRRQEHDRLLADLKRNDAVVMACGIHGRVINLAEKIVTLEIAPKVQINIERSAIQTVQSATAEPKDKEREKS